MEITDYVDFTYVDMPVEKRRHLDVGDIFINQAVANCCGWVIRSKNRHDQATCKCGKASIDGGSWYIKTSGDVSLQTVYFTELYPRKENKNGRSDSVSHTRGTDT